MMGKEFDRREFLELCGRGFLGVCALPHLKRFDRISRFFQGLDVSSQSEISEDEIQFIAEHEIRIGDSSRDVVMMTYDDMGSERQIESILSAYRPYPDCKATFFYLGDRLKWSAKSIGKIAEEGHLLGSHFWNHTPMTTLSSDEIKRWFELNIVALEKILPGYKMKYFRMPYGDGVGNERILTLAAQFGLQHVFWTTGSNGLIPDTYRNVLRAAKPGSIVLSHIFRRYDYTQANMIVDGLLEKGFSLETIDTGKKPGDRYPG
jgi:peptidoglycan/xylan/chitin deacetylase (PgdA/CDA1 family)